MRVSIPVPSHARVAAGDGVWVSGIEGRLVVQRVVSLNGRRWVVVETDGVGPVTVGDVVRHERGLG